MWRVTERIGEYPALEADTSSCLSPIQGAAADPRSNRMSSTCCIREHLFFGQAGTNPKRQRFGQVVPEGGLGSCAERFQAGEVLGYRVSSLFLVA
jgi:hypothetical protein